MSACYVCPTLPCGADCEDSDQLIPSLNCTTETSCSAASLAALHPTNAKIDQLPNELKRQIVSYLEPDLESIRNIRLVSKSWAFLGSPHLLDPTFTMFSHRDDMNRLVDIAQHPYFSQKIKTLVIKWAFMDEVSLRRNLTAPAADEMTYSEDAFQESWGQWQGFMGRQDLYSDTFWNKDLLAFCFNGLTKLDTLVIHPDHTDLEVLRRNKYLLHAWATALHDFEASRRLCEDIFSSLATSSAQISSLSWCSDKTYGIWGFHSLPRTSIELVLPKLATLRLNITRDNFVMPAAGEGEKSVRMFFGKAVKLRNLAVYANRDVPYIDRRPLLIRNINCPGLETLDLDNCPWTFPDIQELLFRHRTTLREVSIRMRVLQHDWEEETKSLLDMMKNLLQLKKLTFISLFARHGEVDIQQVMAPQIAAAWEQWRKPNEPLLPGEEDWDLVREIEDYVLRDGPYPLR